MDEREKVMKGLECCTADLGEYHQDHFCDMCPYKSTDPRITYCFNKSVLMRDALSLLKAQEPGWISVKDRLPEKKPIMIATTAYQNSSDYVLVHVDNVTWPYRRKIVTIGRYDYDCEDWTIRNAYRGVVTHWMSLPEPPKEET